MIDGKLTVWIGRREALPVRAIPYVGGRPRFNPTRLVECLMGTDSSLPRHTSLTAYHRPGGDDLIPVIPREWKLVAEKLRIFEATLRERYSNDSVTKLPPGVFVWADEFKQFFQADLDCVSFSGEQTDVDELTFGPMISGETRSMLMEGFESAAIIAPRKDATSTANAEPEPATSTNDDEQSSTQTDVDHDEILAALFDPVPVEALEKMFPASGRWKNWAGRARRNKLINAKQMRAKFNPYKAGLWFINNGAEEWDIDRLRRVLASKLPARSLDDKHLLTGTVD